MKGALVILAALIIIGIILYVFELRHRRRYEVSEIANDSNPEDKEAEEIQDSGECCGLHLVCEKDSLSPMSDKVIYYDDEELDRFIGRTGNDYTPEEEEEFRDILMTLRQDDIPGWARSVTMRRLNLPPDVRDELLLLVNDLRKSSNPV